MSGPKTITQQFEKSIKNKYKCKQRHALLKVLLLGRKQGQNKPIVFVCLEQQCDNSVRCGPFIIFILDFI